MLFGYCGSLTEKPVGFASVAYVVVCDRVVAGISVALLFDELEFEIDSLLLKKRVADSELDVDSLLLTNSVVETDSLLLADPEIAKV